MRKRGATRQSVTHEPGERYQRGPICMRCGSRGGVAWYNGDWFHPYCEKVQHGKCVATGPRSFVRWQKHAFRVFIDGKMRPETFANRPNAESFLTMFLALPPEQSHRGDHRPASQYSSPQ